MKEHWLWRDAEKLKWWLDILMEVNHEGRKVLLKGSLIECNRGQCVKSLETWAKDWRTTKKTVRTFFLLLQKDSMVVLESVTVSTRITVCNYESYQDCGNGLETQSKRKVNAAETQPSPKQELKELKERKNTLFGAFYEAYGKKAARADAEKAWDKIDLEQMPDIIEKAKLFSSHVTDRQFQPLPASWLNGKRWNDELIPVAPPPINGHQPDMFSQNKKLL